MHIQSVKRRAGLLPPTTLERKRIGFRVSSHVGNAFDYAQRVRISSRKFHVLSQMLGIALMLN